MSSTTLTKSLFERVHTIRSSRANGSVPDRFSPPAERSLLVEVLLAEFAATLPAPLAARISAADSAGTAIEWIFAGAVYRAVAHDPFLAAQFLTLVGDNPSAAGVATATALASKQEPPARDAAWHHRDWAGLCLQLCAVAIVVFARCLLFVLLASLIQPLVVAATLTSIIGDSVWPDLVCSLRASGLTASILLTIAVLWLSLEVVVAPRLLERLRQLPARRRGLPPPLAWRTDTFYVLWYVEAMVALLVVEAILFRLLARSLLEPLCSPWAWGGSAGVAFISVIAIGLAISQAPRVISLGTHGTRAG